MKTYKNETIVVKEDCKEENDKKCLEYDMMLQVLPNMVVFFVNLLHNIKEASKIVYLVHLYIVEILAGIWIAFCIMYRDIDKMPFSDYFW